MEDLDWQEEERKNRETVKSERETFEQFFLDFLDKRGTQERTIYFKCGWILGCPLATLMVRWERQTTSFFFFFFFFWLWMRN